MHNKGDKFIKQKTVYYIKNLIEKLKALRLYFVMCIKRKSKSKMEELYENQPTYTLVEY